MNTISLNDYSIYLDDSLQSLYRFIEEKNYSALFAIVDENTKQHCLPIISEHIVGLHIIETQSGETNKNLYTCEKIWQQLITKNADRKILIINLGGGVIGDMGGFAASCYKRGVDFINIPTTLLSQVDSSIGGKLGIDFKYGKNLIGLFQNPKAVFISSVFFNTLPQRQFINGWAEIFKHALIQDSAQWNIYKQYDILSCHMDEIVFHSLLVKKKVVEIDPYEKGLRKVLNFGHTIGHAIEAYSLEHESTPLLHGEAIAIGMICEAYLSVKKCGLTADELNEIQTVLLKHFPKHDISTFDMNKIIESMRIDKKNEGDTIMAALLSAIGNSVYDIPLTTEDIQESIAFYIQ
ncbi:MAG TPA: 3-dehydroquinate synthase [Chitinophagales bacterium]|nr:3-dehydroquinate synthase [Chitinophagales bacterium]HMW12276.1 3-dehydroquinate synthase [Chitinophagales bacterium]HMX58953.1 3-dehydroquinate synthase [Chitinophagales bacterium]HMY22667.1 3-dehydroquinate synthase [Chitinophagales bacterium]HMZ32883.1 3-dehydroquinate synthase [Chitinophagales bacterium]